MYYHIPQLFLLLIKLQNMGNFFFKMSIFLKIWPDKSQKGPASLRLCISIIYVDFIKLGSLLNFQF